MDNTHDRELRMYGLVPYNLSPIQQGIQFGHAVVEYSQEHSWDPLYQDWAKNWKTFIILNGGTTNNNPLKHGTINKHVEFLHENDVKHAIFQEPDLGDQITAVVFLVDERVFNREKYPDYEDVVKAYGVAGGGDFIPSYDQWLENFSEDTEEREKILVMRDFLKNFRLA